MGRQDEGEPGAETFQATFVLQEGFPPPMNAVSLHLSRRGGRESSVQFECTTYVHSTAYRH